MKQADTRERILDTALELLWTQSYGSVSVDDICRKADARKGSFYHFFPSKSELAAEALERHWESCRPGLDKVFSPLLPPRQRLSGWCELMRCGQRERRSKCGKVCGCPFASLGSELCTQDETVRRKVGEIHERFCRYIESCLREMESLSGGGVESEDLRLKAKAAFSYVIGILQAAKIGDDLALLEALEPGLMALLGLPAEAPAFGRSS